MNTNEYDRQAEEIRNILPSGLYVVIIGSTTFWGRDTQEICAAVASQLSILDNIVLITGGMPGVGETVSRYFLTVRQQMAMEAAIYHILPHGCNPQEVGTTLHSGSTMEERREILGRLPAVFVALEGGPGTVHESSVAMRHHAPVVPIGRTGGFSRSLYAQLDCPHPEITAEWQLLNDSSGNIETLGCAVRKIVKTLAPITVKKND